MSIDCELAPAKLNLALHVRGRAADGYHRIETLFAFCADGDRVCARPDEALTLAIAGPFAGAITADADNLVLRAAQALRAAAWLDDRGAALTLDKALPVAAGIGGGSADAAATLRLLNRLWDAGLDDASLLCLAGELGADVPACVAGRPVVGMARGDRLGDVGDRALAGAPVLLVNPRKPLSTAEIFRRWDGVDRGPLPDGTMRDVWRDGRNDLEPIALALLPELEAALEQLRQGALDGVARLSGSGATCFALYPDFAARDEAAAAFAAAFPSYWTLASHVT